MSNKMKCAWLMLCVVPFAWLIVHNIGPIWLTKPGVYKELYLMSVDLPPNVPTGPFRLSVSRLDAGWAGREREVELAVYEGEKALSIAKDLRELYQRKALHGVTIHDKDDYHNRKVYIRFSHQNVWGISRIERADEAKVRFFGDSNSSSYRVIDVKAIPVEISIYLE